MQKPIILASNSPRRIEILKKNGLHPQVRPADVDETVPAQLNVYQAVMFLALKKALKTEMEVGTGVIIAADTTVYHKNKVLGKPKDEEEAAEMLRGLCGDVHRVFTGVAILDATTFSRRIFYEETRVHFNSYTEEDIQWYIRTGEPMDKAGAYAIQGQWSKFIKEFDGDFDNVVGLPWKRLKIELENFLS